MRRAMSRARSPSRRAGNPDISDLYLAADVLVTDYSSAMFDFALTGRPMLFYAYDLEQYQRSLRGFYFDFAPQAPGRLLRSTEEVLDALRDLPAVARRLRSRSAFADATGCWRTGSQPGGCSITSWPASGLRRPLDDVGRDRLALRGVLGPARPATVSAGDEGVVAQALGRRCPHRRCLAHAGSRAAPAPPRAPPQSASG
jgi:hypothetical protein